MLCDVFIESAYRTPIGSFQGALGQIPAFELAAHLIRHMRTHTPHITHTIDEVIMGCVLTAGLGQAPARQAALHGGIPTSVPTMTLNKVCGSGMKAIMVGSDAIQLKKGQSILAGGMESMSRAPYLLSQARSGYRFGHAETFDHMLLDGLEDAYPHGFEGDLFQAPTTQRCPMGALADTVAASYQFSRADQEAYAKQTWERYHHAHRTGALMREIVPLSLKKMDVTEDEQPQKVNPEKFTKLRPAFHPGGTITAATSSSLADGASVLHLVDQQQASSPIARIVGYTQVARIPQEFTRAPVDAIEKLLQQTGWSLSDVDLFEINEAFAIVPMIAIHDLKLDRDRVNVHGGACTLGHPIGMSGARIVTTLAHALHTHKRKRGVAVACIGGGEATALALELP